MSSAPQPTYAPGPGPRRQDEATASAKTKIVATVGPACAERLGELIDTGVDLFRLNFAHGKHDWLAEIVAAIRREAGQRGRAVGILGDLAGPKIRLQEIPGGMVRLELDACVELVRGERSDDPFQLCSNYAPLVDELSVGDRVLLADGTVALRVVDKCGTGDRVECRVEHPGTLRSRQGINLPGVRLSVPSLTEKDLVDLGFALEQGLDFVSLSFVRTAADVRGLQQEILRRRPETVPAVVAKIEKTEALADLEAIVEAADAVMVARGDLGVEADLVEVPLLQKRIIRACNERRTPVITCTQMLDSMERNSRPTRAEATDVVNAVLDGSDAVMLSGETAIGEHPVDSVAMMSRLVRAAESWGSAGGGRLGRPGTASSPRLAAHDVTEAVVQGAAATAVRLGARLIVVATHSGRTALAVSQQRLPIPILGLSDRAETARRMALYWGVTPLVTEAVRGNPPELLALASRWGHAHGLLGAGDKLVLIASSNWSAPGHDLLLVHEVAEQGRA